LKPSFLRSLRSGARDEAGTGFIEFALALPLLILVVFGVIETSFALLDNHIVTRISREGSNLISRDATLLDAATAMRKMADRPVNFDDGSSKMIFSVIKRGAATGTANYDKPFLYQRYEYGTYGGASHFAGGTGSFGGAPDFRAVNPDTDASLQITNCPPNLLPTPGSLIYVTEVFSRHVLITPLDRFGVTFPTTFSSIAYF
jgi:hypothetical protein